MPYRAELKRPDLKGQFPCSVCGKVFCHSSSLSRHRMQAHFKSYTCTQCNQEISSNETLRSHMFRVHAVSRMFMCRCCNWAFPDKTSLHIHMQSMLRSGQPGDVPVLARSSTEDGPSMGEPSPSVTPRFTPTEALLKVASSSSLLPQSAVAPSIYPPGIRPEHILPALNKDNNALPTNLLNVWMANNPFFNNLAAMQNPLLAQAAIRLARNAGTPTAMSMVKEEVEFDEDSYIEINNTIDDMDESKEGSVVSSDGAEGEKKGGSNKRKATRPVQLTDDMDASDSEIVIDSAPLKMVKEQPSPVIIPRDPLSPTVSDSHTSSGGSSGHTGLDSPQQHVKCYDCQDTKSKLSMTENVLREKNREVEALTGTVDRLQRQIVLLAQACKRNELQALQASQMAMFRSALPPMPSVAPPPMLPTAAPSAEVVKRLFEQLVQQNLANQQRG